MHNSGTEPINDNLHLFASSYGLRCINPSKPDGPSKKNIACLDLLFPLPRWPTHDSRMCGCLTTEPKG